MNAGFSFRAALSALLVCTPFRSPGAENDGLPKVDTPAKPVQEKYHGTSVTDPFQWLEDPSSTEVKQWVAEENKRTRLYFDRLPYREGLAEQLKQMRSEESARYGGIDW